VNDEHREKHARVSEYLRLHELDGVLLARRCNFSWYTSGAHNHVANACDAGGSWLLIDRDQARVITDNIESPRLRTEELAKSGIEVIEHPWTDTDGLAAAIERQAGSMKLACDHPAPGVNAAPLAADFDRLRWQLTPQEIERYGGVCDDTVAALEQAARDALPGQSEHMLCADAAAELRSRGLTPWVLLVAVDDRVRRFRHPLPTGARVRRYFMLVACAERDGLIAACTRIASFEPLEAELAERHRAVATVDAALISGTLPGRTLGEIFAECQDAYRAVGFADEWRRHHQGGSCGYLPREVKASPGEQTEALEDQAFAWNPSVAGTKSEDTVLCTNSGGRMLARATDWPVISAEWKGAALDRPDILVIQ